jgi:hypothetical protein
MGQCHYPHYPDLAKSSGQTIYYSLLLVDNECIATIKVMN